MLGNGYISPQSINIHGDVIPEQAIPCACHVGYSGSHTTTIIVNGADESPVSGL